MRMIVCSTYVLVYRRVQATFGHSHTCFSACSSIHISPCVRVCVSAKCHIDRLIAVVSDSVTLWLVDSSLIHTPSWVIGPAHWFPACQPSQEELGGRKRACRYWLAPDQPHYHLHIPCTPNQCSCSPTACSLTMPSDRVSLCLWLWFFHLSTLFCSLFQCATGCICVMLWYHLHQSIFLIYFLWRLKYFFIDRLHKL